VIATPTDWVLSVAEYSIFIRPDLLQQFWQVMSDGGFITDAVAVIDTSRRTGLSMAMAKSPVVVLCAR